MRDDREPIGKIRLMKCKVVLFMLSLCAKCIPNFLNFSVITSVGGGMGQANLSIWHFWIAHLFSFSFGSVKHSYFLFSIWLEDLSDNWNPAGNTTRIFGVHRWEGGIGWRGWVKATSSFSLQDMNVSCSDLEVYFCGCCRSLTLMLSVSYSCFPSKLITWLWNITMVAPL